MKVVYFHRHLGCGYSINKVTQTIIKSFNNKIEYYVPGRRSIIQDALRNIIFIINHRDKKSINHITGDIHYGILGLIGCKSVLTIHDTTVVDNNKNNKVKQLIFKWVWFKIPLKFATKVVCISETTKESVLRFTKRKDICVIHNAIDDTIHFHDRDTTIKDLYDVLIIGTAPNKNIIRTTQALKGLPVHLTIVGQLSEEQKMCLDENAIEYTLLNGLSDQEIDTCYSRADLVCFCTLFEGFGMPILEANRSGCPIICADIPVLHEVAGSAALFVDPYNIDSIHHSINMLLNNPYERRRLINLGIENVKRFEPNFIKNKWQTLYKEIENL